MAARAAAQWVSMSLKRPSRSLCQWSKEAEGIAAPQALVEEDGEWLYLLQLGFFQTNAAENLVRVGDEEMR